MELILAGILLLVLGVFAGIAAGLLGIGGGTILVPGLYYIFRSFGFEEVAMHAAVGTSLATIILTGISSALAHHKKGAVDLPIFKQFLPGILIGVIIGSYLAGILPTSGLKIIFGVSLFALGVYMLMSRNKSNIFESMPKQPVLSLISAFNGMLATLMGIGGGVLNTPFMTLCNVPIHRAVATSAAIGPFIAAIGAIGFVVIGWNTENLPPYSLGYINLAAFGTIIITSMAFAPLGAKLAHALPVPTLKKAFAVFMLIVAGKMLLEIFTDFKLLG